MSIFLKHILGNIKENIGRTALILISLFGVGLIISVSLGLTFSISQMIDAMSNTAGGFQYIVSSSTEEDITYERVKHVNYDFDYLGVPEYNYGYIYDKDNDKYISSPLVGFNLEYAKKLGLVEVEKEKNIELNNNEIIIAKSYANKYNLKLNDTLEYFDEDGNSHLFKIKYIAKDSGAFVGGAFTAVSIVTTEDDYLNISNKDKIKYNFLCLNYLGHKKIDTVTKELYDIEDDYGLDFSVKSSTGVLEFAGNYIKIGVIVIILVIVVVFFTINSIVKIIMNERIPIIGTFRSIGASSKKMNSILIAEMAMYGLIGGVGGAFVGVGLTKAFFLMFEVVGETMGIEINMISFEKYSAYIILLTIIFLVLFQIALSISEIYKSSKISIKDCIFNKHESIYKYTFTKVIVGILSLIIGIISLVLVKRLTFIHSVISIILLFVAIAMLLPPFTKTLMKLFNRNDNPVMEMSKNTIVNNKLQISSNIIVAVMMAISLISFSLLNYSVKSYKSKIDMVKSDIYISSSFESIKIIPELAGVDGVEKLASLYTTNLASMYNEMTFANHKVDSLYVIYSDNYKNLVDNSNILEIDSNLADNLKDNEVIVSNYFKDAYNLKLGDIVVVKGVTKEKRFTVETPYNLKIVGFTDTSKVNYMSIIMSKKMATDKIQTFDSNKFFIELKNEADYANVKKNLLKSVTYQLVEVYNQDEYKEKINKDMKDAYENIAIVILVIVGIALIGIINNQSVSFMERKKEFAILYSTSMSRKQINNMLSKELLLSYMISSLFSVFFTLMLIRLLRYVISTLGIYIPLSFNIFGIVVLLLIVAFIMIIIYLLMKRKIKRMNIVEEIKYE